MMKTNRSMRGKTIFLVVLILTLLVTAILLSVNTTYGKYSMETEYTLSVKDVDLVP